MNVTSNSESEGTGGAEEQVNVDKISIYSFIHLFILMYSLHTIVHSYHDFKQTILLS